MGATSSQALAATATLVSLAFAGATFERWLVRRRPHEAAWTVSLVFFAAGSAALWLATSRGWDAVSFRAFYLFGGVLNVPFLALGTVYLLAARRVADRVAVGLGLAAAFAAGVVAVAPLTAPVDASSFPAGKEHFGVLPRVFAGVGSGVAALVLVVGALWSAARLVRGRSRPGRPSTVPAGRLAAANLLIALGTLIISAKTLFEGLGDEETAFAAALATGIVVLFVGFLLTGTSRPATADVAAPVAGAPAGELGAPPVPHPTAGTLLEPAVPTRAG